MKKSLMLVFIMVIVSSGFLFANGDNEETAQEEKKVIEMRLGHYVPGDHAGNLAALMFAENVEKRTNGAIHVTVYPANELGNPDELLEANILGAIDMSLPTQGQLDKYSKKFAAVMLPFVFRDYDHAHKVLDGPFMDWVKADIEEQGLIFLSNWEYGFRNLTNSVRPINSPDDVKGLKIRTPPEIQLEAAMSAAGANVTKISFSELYLSLTQNVVDGQENPLSVIYFYKLYEAQKYLALTRHVYNSMVHVMSKKVYDKLTAEQQQIIREESQKAGNFMRDQIMSQESDLIEKLKEKGMVVTEPDLAAFKAVMGPAYETIGNYAGKDNVQKFLDMANKY